MEKPSYVLEVFEGPLDLLLHLIQKNKISIYDIPIFELSKQYMEYLEQMKELNLEVTSEFIVMAAQLLYIKSRMLLPKNPENEEEEDPRLELMEKLLEYSKYKAASRYLEERENIGAYMFYKKPDKLEDVKIENHFEGVSVQDLFEMVRELLQNKKEQIIIPQKSFGAIASRETVTVASKVKQLLQMLSERKRCGFLEVFYELPSRPHIVAMFLGMLELLKRNQIDIKKRGGELYICQAE